MSPPPLLLPAPTFEGVREVVAEPLKFKAKLAIGEDAYTSLRMINRTREVWDVLGAAGAGAAVAKSGMVASVLGASATPLGWVAFAALASGGACYGLYRLLGNTKGQRVIEIPKYLNTPLDTLGLALFDLITPLALRLAAVDGAVEPAERDFLVRHLIRDWGLGEPFVTQAVQAVELGLADASLDAIAVEGAEFLRMNPDCNHQAIVDDLAVFLREMLEAGGPLTAQESEALARTVQLLRTTPPGELTKAWAQALTAAGGAASQVRTVAGGAASQVLTVAGDAATQVRTAVAGAASWTQERLPQPETIRRVGEGAAQQTLQVAQLTLQRAQQTAESARKVAHRAAQAAAQKAAEVAQERLPDAEQVRQQGGRALEQASKMSKAASEAARQAATEAARLAADKATALLQQPGALADRLLRKRPPPQS